jgi:hypothetical protein
MTLLKGFQAVTFSCQIKQLTNLAGVSGTRRKWRKPLRRRGMTLSWQNSNQIIMNTWCTSDYGATICVTWLTWTIIRLPWPEAILPKDQHPCSFQWPSQKLYNLQGDIRLGITVSPESVSQIWYQVCVHEATFLEVAVVNMLLWGWMCWDGAALTSHVLSQSMQFWLQSDHLSF